LIGGRKVASPDAGSLNNPIIGRFNALGGQFGDQVGIAQAALGKVAASARNSGINRHEAG